MKKFVQLILLAISIQAFSQNKLPGLIYSCEKKVNGISKYDIFNSSGQKILPQSVDWAYSNTWSWLFVQEKKNKFISIYTYGGKKLPLDSIEASQSTYMDLNRVALKRNGKWGFYDRQGKLKVLHAYDSVSHFEENKAAVKVGPDVFMIDTNGVKLDEAYDPADQRYSFTDFDMAVGMGGEFYHNDFKKVKKDGKTGLMDVKKASLVVPQEYEDLVDMKEGFKVVTAKKAGKCGLVAFGGKIVIPIVYDSVFVLNDYTD